MKKKWIYIEPFVFIWQDSTHFLFYNSLNGKKVFISKNDTIVPIVQSLFKEESSYSVQLEGDITDKKDFGEFVKVISSNQMGNIIEGSDLERPVNIPPKLVLDRSVDKSKRNNSEYFDGTILDNLKELNIQVSGDCNLDCEGCSEYHLQLTHCRKSEHSLSAQKIEKLVLQAKYLSLEKINITGGDILSLRNFEFIIDVFNTAHVAKIYNIHYRHINFDKIQYILDKDETSLVRISVHTNDIAEDELMKRIKYLERYNSKILWSFVVSSENELELCYSVLEKCKSIHNEIKPFYNKRNEKFIREFVFINNEDIEEINLSKREIFANQVLNRNYFGKMTIQADGQVFDNNNFDAVGNIGDRLENIVHRILWEGKSWRWVRSNDICDSCLYKLICPPPSNLELAMKSMTVCQRPRNYKTV